MSTISQMNSYHIFVIVLWKLPKSKNNFNVSLSRQQDLVSNWLSVIVSLPSEYGLNFLLRNSLMQSLITQSLYRLGRLHRLSFLMKNPKSSYLSLIVFVLSFFFILILFFCVHGEYYRETILPYTRLSGLFAFTILGKESFRLVVHKEAQDLFEYFQSMTDGNLFRLGISKFMGYLIILGSAVMKFPQIIQIIRNQSVVGLSIYSFYFECGENIPFVIYNLVHVRCYLFLILYRITLFRLMESVLSF